MSLKIENKNVIITIPVEISSLYSKVKIGKKKSVAKPLFLRRKRSVIVNKFIIQNFYKSLQFYRFSVYYIKIIIERDKYGEF